MKILTSLLILFVVVGTAHANDVSCQVDMLKPKLKASVIHDETDMPAGITVSDAIIRLKKQNKSESIELESAQVENEETENEPVKKESGLGSMFDILLPSKLRNPVQ